MVCLFCGKELMLRQWEIDDRIKTINRKYCDRHCAARKRGVDPIKTRYRCLKIKGRRISEHRWVMEQYLGRKLETHEYVHHIDHNKLNNEISNLTVLNSQEHGIEHTYHPIIKNCVICGSEFKPHKTKRKIKKTCNKECRYELNRRSMLSKSKKRSKS